MDRDPRVTALDDHYYKGNLTFDQFILGIILAACAYLAQTTAFGVVAWSPATLQLATLVILGLSSWLGFKRIEATIHLLGANARYLELCKARGVNSLPDHFQCVKAWGNTTGLYYRWRNRLMFLGFALHVIGKVLLAYPQFWILP